jgi:hypothetical protein
MGVEDRAFLVEAAKDCARFSVPLAVEWAAVFPDVVERVTTLRARQALASSNGEFLQTFILLPSSAAVRCSAPGPQNLRVLGLRVPEGEPWIQSLNF